MKSILKFKSIPQIYSPLFINQSISIAPKLVSKNINSLYFNKVKVIAKSFIKNEFKI